MGEWPGRDGADDAIRHGVADLAAVFGGFHGADAHGDGDADVYADGDGYGYVLTRTWGQFVALLARTFAVSFGIVAFFGGIGVFVANGVGEHAARFGRDVFTVGYGGVGLVGVGVGFAAVVCVGVLCRPRRVATRISAGVGESAGYGQLWTGGGDFLYRDSRGGSVTVDD